MMQNGPAGTNAVSAERKLRFPHWTSPWWIPVFLGLGWVPLFSADWISRLFPGLRTSAVAFGLAWGLTLSLALTALAIISALAQFSRLLFYRSKPRH